MTTQSWSVADGARTDGAERTLLVAQENDGLVATSIRLLRIVGDELQVGGTWARDSVINRGIADWLRDVSSDLGTIKAYLAGIDADLTDGGESAATLLRRLLEAQRTTLYSSPGDVLIPAGGALTDVTGWVDLGVWRSAVVGMRNTGATNNISSWRLDFSPDNGTTVLITGASATTLPPASGYTVAVEANPASATPMITAHLVTCGWRYVRLVVGSAGGTNARAIIIGGQP